jgi:hypothetical protein
MQDLECHAIDFTTAFLNGELQEEIYAEQPALFNDGSGKVLKLHKALYGLKQSPRQWYKALTSTMKKFGCIFCPVDGAVARMQYKGSQVWLLFYVDDVLVASQKPSDVEAVKKMLLEEYKGTDKGELGNFLGLRFSQDRSKLQIRVDQSAYVSKILQEANLQDGRPQAIPLSPNQHRDPQGVPLDDKEAALYRKRVGALMYLANMARPDLAYSAAYLVRYLQAPHTAQLNQLTQVLRYLIATAGHLLTLGHQSDEPLVGWVDADWSQERGKKSVGGYCFLVNGSLVSWKSKRLPTVARSSMEAEYMAAGEAVREAIFLTWLGYFQTGKCGCIPIRTDSKAALSVIKNPVVEDMRKHIDVVLNHVREREDARYVDFSWVPGSENVADVFAKALPRPAFERYRNCLNLQAFLC